ncbi:MAG: hypothetical protein KAU38_09115 [Desulfobacterales bacterium]|nr:hypothetical protein [Desulfobacterales bacterium]
MTANKKFAAFGKKDDHLFTPEGMSGFARSTPALWNVYRIKSLSLGMYGVLNWDEAYSSGVKLIPPGSPDRAKEISLCALVRNNEFSASFAPLR